MQGEFPLDTALAVLVDFWDYQVLARPTNVVSRWSEYVKENGRDPLAGLREITV